ncbi:MAG: hypothetical protein HPY79_05055 [Bacteroidales bacterium]|nr:hypothetical protein [Bacteroidales bacterium]
MKSELLKQVRNLFNPKKVKRNRRVLIFLFFVLLSSIIWFFNKLEKDYYTTISIPIRFYHFPDDKVLVNPLPKQLNVNVFGRGFTLLRYKLLSYKPIYIDVLAKINLKSNTDRDLIYFNTETIIPSLDKELSDEMKILSVEPKNIKLIFSKKMSKKVFVIPNITYSVDKDFLVDSVQVKPSVVLLTGPMFLIDTIDTIYTLTQKINSIDKDIRLKVSLKPIQFCEMSTDNVNVHIKLQKKTEKTIAIPINSIFSNKQKNIIFLPSHIVLKFSVGIHYYNEIDASQFSFRFEKVPVSNSNSEVYLIKILNYPKKVINLQVTPSYFTVLKK